MLGKCVGTIPLQLGVAQLPPCPWQRPRRRDGVDPVVGHPFGPAYSPNDDNAIVELGFVPALHIGVILLWSLSESGVGRRGPQIGHCICAAPVLGQLPHDNRQEHAVRFAQHGKQREMIHLCRDHIVRHVYRAGDALL